MPAEMYQEWVAHVGHIRWHRETMHSLQCTRTQCFTFTWFSARLSVQEITLGY